MTTKKGGRPVSAATLARLALPCCEKCRGLVLHATGVRCDKGHADLKATGCPDYRDVSRSRIRVMGGVSGVMFERVA